MWERPPACNAQRLTNKKAGQLVRASRERGLVPCCDHHHEGQPVPAEALETNLLLRELRLHIDRRLHPPEGLAPRAVVEPHRLRREEVVVACPQKPLQRGVASVLPQRHVGVVLLVAGGLNQAAKLGNKCNPFFQSFLAVGLQPDALVRPI